MTVRQLKGLRARHFIGESKSQARATRKTGNAIAASHWHANIQPHPGTDGSWHGTTSWEGTSIHPSLTHSSCLTPAFMAERDIPARLGRQLCGSVSWLWPLPASGPSPASSLDEPHWMKHKSPWLCASTVLQQLKTRVSSIPPFS